MVSTSVQNKVVLPPSQFILQSFNLVDQNLAQDLKEIVNNLNDIRSDNFKQNLSNYITQQTSQQINSATFKVESSQQSSFESIAASFGVEGSFGFYSGSVKASMMHDEYKTSSSFSSSCIGEVNTGTTYLSNTAELTDQNLTEFFDEQFVNDLRSVNSLASAKAFVNKYGTHIATGWNLGGSFSIHISAATETYDDQTQIESQVKAAYQSVVSVTASANAAYNLNAKGLQSGFKQEVLVVGGSAVAAGSIDITQSSTNIDTWIKTCGVDTTYGLYKSISMVDLAQATENAAAAKFIQQYIDLFILKYSLENPTLFSDYTSLVQYQTVSKTVSITKSHYKIVSGGARVSPMKNSHSFLTGCFPNTQQIPNGGGLLEITGWTATCHDCMVPADTSGHLTSYALAVYDPGNYLEVFISASPGTNPFAGGDTAQNMSVANFVMTGGGCQTTILSGNHSKFIVSNGPRQVNGSWVSWQAIACDYVGAASEVELVGYAIGIRSDYLNITGTVYQRQSSQEVQHGNQQAQVAGGQKLIGGGVVLGAVTNGGDGNLVRQSYPLNSTTWTEFNKDLNGSNSPCFVTAYAIGVTVQIKGLED